MHKYSRILIVNPFGIGDVLFTLPLIRNIKDNFPESKVGFLCNKRTAPILKSQPEIDYIFEYERDEFRAIEKKSFWAGIIKHRQFLQELKRLKFGVVFDLSLSSTYGFFSWYAGIKKRIGFNYKNRGRFLNCKIELDYYKDKHVAEYYVDLLKLLNIKPEKKDMRIFLPDEARQKAREFLKDKRVNQGVPLLMIMPCGGKSWGDKSALKHWDYGKFADTARLLIESSGCNIVLAGSFSEEKPIRKVADSLSKPPVLAIGWPLLDFLGLLSQMDLLITNDGGPLHMAVSLGVKTVSIFGPVDEKVYGSYTLLKNNHYVLKRTLDCRPCYRKFRMPACPYDRRCLKDITVEQVLTAVQSLIKD